MSAQFAVPPTVIHDPGIGVTLARPSRRIPGLLLCLAVTGTAVALERVEAAAFGATRLEALLLAILVRTVWSPGQRRLPGIVFSAKTLLRSRSSCSVRR